MIFLIEAHNRGDHAHLLRQAFNMRDRAFSDLVDRKGLSALEQRDRYDNLNPAYLIWCDDCRTKAYGAIRLMPTTGPTLLQGAFHSELPDAGALSAPGIWEGAYMGIDIAPILEDLPDVCAERALHIFLTAIHEAALHHGISAIVFSYRAAMRASYEDSGAGFAELGRASNCDGETICCGIFEISPQTVAAVRDRAHLPRPIYRPPIFAPANIRHLDPVA